MDALGTLLVEVLDHLVVDVCVPPLPDLALAIGDQLQTAAQCLRAGLPDIRLGEKGEGVQ